MLYTPCTHKPKFGQAGIIPGHPLKPDFFLAMNEGGGNQVWDLISKKSCDFDSTYTPDWNETGIEFDSDYERIPIDSLNNIIPAGSDFTIFFKQKHISSAAARLYWYATGTTFQTFSIFWHVPDEYFSVQINASTNDFEGVDSDFYLFDTLAITLEGTNLKIYRNGILELTDTTNAVPTTSDVFDIGGYAGDSDRYASSIIDFFYIKRQVLSGGEIASLSANPWQWMYDKSEMILRSVWAVAGGTVYNMSMSESSSISDALGGLASFIGSMAESNSITDSTGSLLSLIGSISESNNITDSITSLANFLLSLSESTSISDAFTSTAEFIRSIAESASINDVESAALEFASNISESTNISDAFISLVNFIGTLTDNPTITDLYSGIIGYYHTISESVSISDQISGLKDAIGTISEISTITDDLSSIANMLVSLSESNNIQDTLAAIGTFAHAINESATIEDAFRIIGGIVEFVKIFGEVNLDSLIRGAIKDQGKISGEIDKQNIIRGEVDDDGN